MFKKLALIVLCGISSLHATDAPKAGFIQKVKNSPALIKVFGAIIPCIAVFLSMDTVIKTYKDNPEWHNIADIAYYIKLLSAAVAAIFSNLLFKINFKKWLKEQSSQYKVCKESDPILLQTID